jgi:hypothetical protein
MESKGSKGRNKRLKRLEKGAKKRGRSTRCKKNDVFGQLDPRIQLEVLRGFRGLAAGWIGNGWTMNEAIDQGRCTSVLVLLCR